MALTMCLSLGITAFAAERDNGFTDVAESDYFYPAVQWAVEQKITEGTGNGNFSPDVTLDRAMCLTLLYRMQGAPLDEAAAADPVDLEALREDATLEKYTGCVSCFGCKREKNKGRCVCRDGLSPVLDAIREADGLIIGSPNYLGDLTASFRALYERLIFQNLTYNAETLCCNGRFIPVLLIMTSNAPDGNYDGLLRNYRETLNRFVGPTEVFTAGDTLQLKDYGKTDWPWTFFDPEQKRLRHETVFPQKRARAFELGAALATRNE